MIATVELLPDQATAIAEVVGCAPVNRLEAYLGTLPQVTYPLRHWFEPGLYIRQVVLPAETIFTTKIHRFEHRYLIGKGAAHVWTREAGWTILRGRTWGVTKPLTRRVIVTIEETIWTTFHKTNETDLAKIEAEIIVPHETAPQGDIDEAMRIFSLQ